MGETALLAMLSYLGGATTHLEWTQDEKLDHILEQEALLDKLQAGRFDVSLGLAIEVVDAEEEVIQFGREDAEEKLPNLGFSLSLPGPMSKGLE